MLVELMKVFFAIIYLLEKMLNLNIKIKKRSFVYFFVLSFINIYFNGKIYIKYRSIFKYLILDYYFINLFIIVLKIIKKIFLFKKI